MSKNNTHKPHTGKSTRQIIMGIELMVYGNHVVVIIPHDTSKSSYDVKMTTSLVKCCVGGVCFYDGVWYMDGGGSLQFATTDSVPTYVAIEESSSGGENIYIIDHEVVVSRIDELMGTNYNEIVFDVPLPKHTLDEPVKPKPYFSGKLCG